jgi:glutamate racemase
MIIVQYSKPLLPRQWISERGILESKTIGVFDSGVGGLSVLREIRALLPAQPAIYFADQGHVPYGSRSIEEVRSFAHTITDYLLELGARLIVVACNTASVAALQSLRRAYPDIPFVGMEPAVKPAVEASHSGKVGVLATAATFQTAMYASVVERFARGVTLLEDPCIGLVDQIEKGDLEGEHTRAILERVLLPMKSAGVDTVVMGCTHYPFVIPLIQQIVGPDVRVIDPAPAIAQQTRRMLEKHDLLAIGENQAAVTYITSGDAESFEYSLYKLLKVEGSARQVIWQDGRIIAAA